MLIDRVHARFCQVWNNSNRKKKSLLQTLTQQLLPDASGDFNKDIKAIEMHLTSAYCVSQQYEDAEGFMKGQLFIYSFFIYFLYQAKQ